MAEPEGLQRQKALHVIGHPKTQRPILASPDLGPAQPKPRRFSCGAAIPEQRNPLLFVVVPRTSVLRRVGRPDGAFGLTLGRKQHPTTEGQGREEEVEGKEEEGEDRHQGIPLLI